MPAGEARGTGARAATTPAVDPEALAAQLRVLANARRLRLLPFLVRPRTVEDVAAELGIARQNAQEHLEQLEEMGAVERLAGAKRGAAQFAVVPQRLFALQEAVGALADLQPQAAAGGFRPTAPDAGAPSAPSERDLPRLTIVRGLRLGATSALAGAGPWLVGREPSAAVCLDYDPFASVRHAEVRRVRGGFELADLYSSNGTTLEWERLERGGSAALVNGAVIGVGRTILLYRSP